mmetsp:Transcript_30525/g.72630  ORF Transcript_30525/g.72630 Transcript_30525/m.72630 type:complete len:242 (+) Transcript_30525:109-834(+)
MHKRLPRSRGVALSNTVVCYLCNGYNTPPLLFSPIFGDSRKYSLQSHLRCTSLDNAILNVLRQEQRPLSRSYQIFHAVRGQTRKVCLPARKCQLDVVIVVAHAIPARFERHLRVTSPRAQDFVDEVLGAPLLARHARVEVDASEIGTAIQIIRHALLPRIPGNEVVEGFSELGRLVPTVHPKCGRIAPIIYLVSLFLKLAGEFPQLPVSLADRFRVKRASYLLYPGPPLHVLHETEGLTVR